jgi:hypothetical protein
MPDVAHRSEADTGNVRRRVRYEGLKLPCQPVTATEAIDPEWAPRTFHCRSSKGGAALTDNQHPEETCRAKAAAGERAIADHLASGTVTVIERQTPAHGFEHFFGQIRRSLPIALATLHSASRARRKLRAQASRSLDRRQTIPAISGQSLSSSGSRSAAGGNSHELFEMSPHT